MIDDALIADLAKLHAPEARALRLKWKLGTSGAKITHAEAHRLYALEGDQLRATVDLGLDRRRDAEAHFAWRKDQKKSHKKKGRK